MARYNLIAARKAEDSAAYVPAFKYATVGIECLGKSAWEKEYDLALRLYTQAAEAAYMSALFDEMNQMLEVVFREAKSLIEKIPLYRIRILSLKASNKLLESIDCGLEVLEQLGIRFPEATPENTGIELTKTLQILEGKTNEDLLNYPEMKNAEKIASMKIISDLNSSVYWARAELFPFIVFKSVELSVDHGNTKVSSFAYGTFGVILSGVVGDMKRAYEFGELGIEVLERFSAKEWLAQVYCPHYALIVPWNDHVNKTFKPLIESVRVGLETGSIEYSMINANIVCIHGYLSGKQLSALQKDMEDYSALMKSFKQTTNYNFNQIYHQAVLNLQGHGVDPCKLVGSVYNEDEMLPVHLDANDVTASFFLYFNKMILNFLFGKYDTALNCRDEAEARLAAILAKLENTTYNFIDSLLSLALMRGAGTTDGEKAEFLARVEKNQAVLKKWADDAPMNFIHKYDLVQAEVGRVTGNATQAIDSYRRAIRGASENGYLNEEALAHELAGEYFLELQLVEMGDKHIRDAFQVYQRWGAVAKTRQLAQKYPEHIVVNSRPGDSKDLNSTLPNQGNVDIVSVMKAATAIQGEIVLSRLLQKLMSVLIENAGASRGCLLLQENNELLLQAEVTTDGSSVLQNLPLDEFKSVPRSVISYVAHSHLSVVIANGPEDAIFGSDPYITKQEARSIHCSPIVLRGKLIAIIYLENNLASNTFTKERVNLLDLLSGQIAISMHNAMLYDRLEQKVRERTQKIEAQKRKLESEKARSDELLLNILPQKTAEELKRHNKTRAVRHENVTVLFSDIINFTQLSAGMSPEDLVRELDDYFGHMDEITVSYGVEKIKTIGDAYLAAGGVPVADPDAAVKMIDCAKDMLSYVEKMKELRELEGRTYFDIRIGLHTGPVVAGVVGLRKFSYDIWGETVNIASRCEAESKPNMINISDSTYKLVKNRFDCTYRGKIKAKNMEEQDMYFVNRTVRKSLNMEGVFRRGSLRREQLRALLYQSLGALVSESSSDDDLLEGSLSDLESSPT
jgi:class 3 adenylate cyclase